MRQCHNLITNQKYISERTAGEQHLPKLFWHIQTSNPGTLTCLFGKHGKT